MNKHKLDWAMTAQPIEGFGSEAIPACNAVKKPIKEPAEVQKERREREETSLVP